MSGDRDEKHYMRVGQDARQHTSACIRRWAIDHPCSSSSVVERVSTFS